jgi:hypothetical protein
VDAALQAYGSGTTLEFAALLELTPHEVEAHLDAAGATRRDHLWTISVPTRMS